MDSHIDWFRIFRAKAIKREIYSKNPYGDWINKHQTELKDIPYLSSSTEEKESFDNRCRLFNYTIEEIQEIITPMAQNGKEAIGSMGNDTPLAIFSDQNQLLPN